MKQRKLRRFVTQNNYGKWTGKLEEVKKITSIISKEENIYIQPASGGTNRLRLEPG